MFGKECVRQKHQAGVGSQNMQSLSRSVLTKQQYKDTADGGKNAQNQCDGLFGV